MLRIYNSLTKKIESFHPSSPLRVTMYACGPTVYDYATIGNFRTYILSDVLLRTLRFCKLQVTYVMNITDVGHLTGDNFGDADSGEDKMEKSAKRLGKNAWEIAQFYTDAFIKDYELLRLEKPLIFAKATENIPEQIVLIKKLEEEGFTYQITDGIYFDTIKFPEYGELSTLDEVRDGARVEINKEKRSSRDFALWKFSNSKEKSLSGREAVHKKRQMEWDSPWGKGFPGWHIECSAMSLKYLSLGIFDEGKFHAENSQTIDIHLGGIDLQSIHHQNEIAQAEGATGKKFVKYWVHGAFILVDGKKMSKSLGNNYIMEDVTKNGFDPLALRYLYLQTHYRQEMNFTWGSLEASHNALVHLRDEVANLSEDKNHGDKVYEQRFIDALQNDLDMPRALAIVWELIKSRRSDGEKLASIMKFDEVLGLDITRNRHIKEIYISVPDNINELIVKRTILRKEGKYQDADKIREELRKEGYIIEDKNGVTIPRKLK
ncbi:cysteine--tRNA ligase [Candidatus Levyibacteriota bacterium]|nr:cysteine--tRNA ligase [Candidatus Levybacteria bacterium]